jgi:RIO-like serine/threonine protein kinase
MQLKKLLKKNSVTVVDGNRAVIKVVGTPFDWLTRRLCRHEAQCLAKLTELGFAGAPKLIRASSNSMTMERIDGTSLRRHPCLDQALFLRILDVVRELHRLGFAHGNLRLDNIFISDSRGPVLIDFETCCPRSNPLFFLVRFNDDVRLYLLWQSRVVQTDRDLARKSFPRYVTLAMFVIAPLNRFAAILTSLKKKLRKSLRASA